MSFEGAIVNYNWTDLVLTSVKDTVRVDGESFVDTSNQKVGEAARDEVLTLALTTEINSGLGSINGTLRHKHIWGSSRTRAMAITWRGT
jgi:hypothetical protein